MPSLMPSLFRYFIIVGGVLVVGLIGLNAVLEPGGPGPSMVKQQPKAQPVRYDPGASLVERLRTEEAARKAAAQPEKNPAVPQPVTTSVSAAPARPQVTQAAVPAQAQPVTPAAAQPAPATAIEPAHSVPAALTGVPTEDAPTQAVRHAQEQIKAEKARKKRLARERAKVKAIEEASSRQQDQFYYGYAPRPTYGPFGQGGGWSRGW